MPGTDPQFTDTRMCPVTTHIRVLISQSDA